MQPSSWLTTPATTHRKDELTRARTLTAGLPTAYQAYALAKQEQMRQIAIDLACERLAAPEPNAAPPRHALRQALAVLSTWLPRRPALGEAPQPRRSATR